MFGSSAAAAAAAAQTPEEVDFGNALHAALARVVLLADQRIAEWGVAHNIPVDAASETPFTAVEGKHGGFKADDWTVKSPPSPSSSLSSPPPDSPPLDAATVSDSKQVRVSVVDDFMTFVEDIDEEDDEELDEDPGSSKSTKSTRNPSSSKSDGDDIHPPLRISAMLTTEYSDRPTTVRRAVESETGWWKGMFGKLSGIWTKGDSSSSASATTSTTSTTAFPSAGGPRSRRSEPAGGAGRADSPPSGPPRVRFASSTDSIPQNTELEKADDGEEPFDILNADVTVENVLKVAQKYYASPDAAPLTTQELEDITEELDVEVITIPFGDGILDKRPKLYPNTELTLFTHVQPSCENVRVTLLVPETIHGKGEDPPKAVVFTLQKPGWFFDIMLSLFNSEHTSDNVKTVLKPFILLQAQRKGRVSRDWSAFQQLLETSNLTTYPLLAEMFDGKRQYHGNVTVKLPHFGIWDGEKAITVSFRPGERTARLPTSFAVAYPFVSSTPEKKRPPKGYIASMSVVALDPQQQQRRVHAVA